MDKVMSDGSIKQNTYHVNLCSSCNIQNIHTKEDPPISHQVTSSSNKFTASSTKIKSTMQLHLWLSIIFLQVIWLLFATLLPASSHSLKTPAQNWKGMKKGRHTQLKGKTLRNRFMKTDSRKRKVYCLSYILQNDKWGNHQQDRGGGLKCHFYTFFIHTYSLIWI